MKGKMVISNFAMCNTVTIPTSVGDLIDRITILKLKSDRIKNPNQLEHVKTELNLLVHPYKKMKESLINYLEIDELENVLMDINAQLWDYEDQIRQQVDDADIAQTARAIINTNNLRSSIKYKINSLLNSYIIEEKSYSKAVPYDS
jgi:hypothetical protein